MFEENVISKSSHKQNYEWRQNSAMVTKHCLMNRYDFHSNVEQSKGFMMKKKGA